MNYRGSEGEIIRPPEMAMPATPLPRQPSIYSLTFEEFQNTMGFPDKDFGSMNMDELIRNIWSVEESQTMASASGTAVDSSGGSCVGPALQRQSSLTLPRTISQKTVDEVWRNLAEPEPNCLSFHQQQHQHQQQQRQPTLAEITLEEFLLRAGVVREDLNQSGSADDNSTIFGDLPDSKSNVGFGLGFLNGSVAPNSIPDTSATAVGSCLTSLPMGNPVDLASPRGLGNPVNLASPRGIRAGGIFGIGDTAMNNGLIPGVTVAVGGSPRNQIPPDGFVKRDMDLSSLAPVPYMLSEVMRGKKRSGTVEKVVERRQKRMIKNRESAARSRARKQAYTMELEAEVAKLKEQNEELQKKQEEYVETQKTQVLEMINQQYGAKKLCLRRAHTGPW